MNVDVMKSPYLRYKARGGPEDINGLHPSGSDELQEIALEEVMGMGTENYWSLGCCFGGSKADCGRSLGCNMTTGTTPCPSAYPSCTC